MITEEREAIAGQIRAEMARKRVTRAEMARRIGVSRTALADRLDGAKAFDTDLLVRIAQVLDLRVIDLFPEIPTTSTPAGSA